MQRRLTTILAADVVGYSRLAAADEEGTVSRLRALRQELIDPVIAASNGRTVKLTGDGRLVEFASVVDAVRAALEVQRGMATRNANIAPDRRIEFRVGVHLGDVVVESDGDLMGDGVNIAARLEGICAPGGVCLSNAAYEQVRDKIAAEFTDLGEKELKNIARPVRVFSISPQSTSATPAPSATPAKAGVHSSAASPSATVDTGFRRYGAESDKAPPRLSIVVLPFANIGGDPEQEYFVDGVTESLTTDLSRISGSFVIARNTAFTYKGKPFDVKQIGRELGVRYVLEGSVQRGGNRLRVNVQLIDTETGNHLWAERFDKPLADLFDMQDEIVARLANQLSAQLIAAEARRAERSPNPDSMDLYFQGQAWMNRGMNPQYLAEAHRLFDGALALSPDNVDALVGLAWTDSYMAGSFTADRPARLAAAEAVVTRALTLAPNHAGAHFVLGTIQAFTNRATQGIAECEHALALDRNLFTAHQTMAGAKTFIGHAEESEHHILEALRLSPRDAQANGWMAIAGAAKLYLGRDEEAVAWLRRAVEANRNSATQHFWLAASLAQLGRIEEARTAAQTGLLLDPTFTIHRFRAGASSDNPTYLAQRERIYDGMRKAGVPEGRAS
jgi:TolB-like protein/class 3 adenylate cyclase